MLEDLFQCGPAMPGPLALYLSDKQPATLKVACHLADAWETYNPSHSTLQRQIVPPRYLLGSNRPQNGPPSKPPCTICKKFGYAEAECRYREHNHQVNNPLQPTNNRPSSSPSNYAPPSQHTITVGRSSYPRGPCQDCGASGHSSYGYPACPKHVVAPRHVNLISATASLAELPERTHPERWTVTWVDEQSLTIPTVKLRVITPWSNKIHRLGVVKRIRHGVEFLLGQDILWGCPTPTPLCCLTASVSESSVTSSDRDTSSVTAVPPSAKPSIRPRATLSNPHRTHSRPSPDTGGLAPPGPPSALPNTNSLPVPLKSPGQCQAPPISAGSSMPTLLPLPGPELVPVPDPEPDSDPPMEDPPNLTTLPPAGDDPLAGLDTTFFLVDHELSGQDVGAGSVPTTVVAAAKVGDQLVATEAAPDPAADGAPFCSSELSDPGTCLEEIACVTYDPTQGFMQRQMFEKRNMKWIYRLRLTD
ncbi:uncharacterized protein [Macrobrachium rosenbergii]|uniref:uncharacterized protein n=1 Tax=Macrobrachium rosenbergii TaxID=79674 RepID=UPI0034D5EB48